LRKIANRIERQNRISPDKAKPSEEIRTPVKPLILAGTGRVYATQNQRLCVFCFFPN
jgi:hypothetical protein